MGRENVGQVLNLRGQLLGKFHQHLDARYVVPSLGGNFVPVADARVLSPYQIHGQAWHHLARLGNGTGLDVVFPYIGYIFHENYKITC